MKPWTRAALSYASLFSLIAFGFALGGIWTSAADLSGKLLGTSGLSLGLALLWLVVAVVVEKIG